MPNGVSRDFIDLLARQREQARSSLKTVPVLLFAGYVVAELADPSALGLHVQAYAAALGIAAAVAYVAAGRVLDGLEASLQARWDRWMAAASGAGTLLAARDRVAGEAGLTASAPLVGAGIVLGNVATLAMLWFAAPGAAGVALVVVGVDAVWIAGHAVWHLRSLRWSQRFDQAVQEMWRDGELGVYGGSPRRG